MRRLCHAPFNPHQETNMSDERGIETVIDYPVPGFPMRYRWHLGDWLKIFDKQVDLISQDIERAKSENKLILYLSCPISARGGGSSMTNVDIARHVERQLLERLGEAFWVLNPAQYQLESKAGKGLMEQHAGSLGIDLADLRRRAQPGGGDYMRMWTKVLVRNPAVINSQRVPENTGQYFDAFYFLGPKDVETFFRDGEQTLTAGIQNYFARKFAVDASFRDSYSRADIRWGTRDPAMPVTQSDQDARANWESMRLDFLRFYALRASANFSLGSHDEWLIYHFLNAGRRRLTERPDADMEGGDVGTQIAGFFDGSQLEPGASEVMLSPGYSRGNAMQANGEVS
jgi:hypothetical protein